MAISPLGLFVCLLLSGNTQAEHRKNDCMDNSLFARSLGDIPALRQLVRALSTQHPD